MPSENLHITLVFMGSVDASARIYAEAVADDLRAVSAELCLDQLGYWPGPQVLWLGASTVPPETSSTSSVTMIEPLRVMRLRTAETIPPIVTVSPGL